MLAMIMMVAVAVAVAAAMVTAIHPHLRIQMTPHPRNLVLQLLNKMVLIPVAVHHHQVDYLQEPLLVLQYPVVLLYMQLAQCW